MKSKKIKFTVLLSIFFMTLSSNAAPTNETDKLIGEFCYSNNINMEIYQIENGEKYTIDNDGRVVTYGSAYIVDEIIASEGGINGKCKIK